MKFRRMVIGLAAVLLVFAIASAKQQAAVQALRAEDELRAVVREWLAAEQSGDRAALNRIIADDFIGSAFGGNGVSKSDLVPSEGEDAPRFPSSSLKEYKVRAFGATGVVMGRLALENAALPGQIRFTIVLLKRQAGWQMVAAQLARVEQPGS